MWAYDFFQAESQVKTLKTHLKANNTFLRWYTREYYLPEESRLSGAGRTCRLIITLLVYTAVVLYFTARKDAEYARECSWRNTCKLGCVLDNFPDIQCSAVPNMTVEHGGQLFEMLYKYEYVDPKESPTSDTFSRCVERVPTYSRGSSEVEQKILHDNRLPRTQVCFSYCKDANDAGAVLPTVEAVEGTPSTAVAKPASWWRLTDLYNNEMDTRPYCSTADPLSDERSALLCVDTSDECEVTRFKHEECLGDTGACFNPYIVLVSMVTCIPFQFLFDIVIIYTISLKIETIQDCGKGSSKCAMQWGITVTVCTVALLVSATIVKSSGRPGMIWFTWFMVILVDQVRNIVALTFVWYVVLRRCGQVPLLDEEVAYKADEDEEIAQSPVEIIRRLVAMVVESRPFDIVVYILVGVYALFILLQMGIEPYIMHDTTAMDIMWWVDSIFLTIFVVEIVARTIAHGLWYLKDPWNLFDAAVVFTSVAFKFDRNTSNTVSLLRLLRLLRLVLVLRKAGADKKRPPMQGGGLSFSSPVERVLDILKEIRETKGISVSVREQIDWVSDIIASNKLYSISVDADKSKTGEGFLEQEVQDWVRLASDVSGESTWRDNELEKFLVGGNKKRLRDELTEQARVILREDVDAAVVTRREVEEEKRANQEETPAASGAQEAYEKRKQQTVFGGGVFGGAGRKTTRAFGQSTTEASLSAPQQSSGHPLLMTGPPSEPVEVEGDRVLQYLHDNVCSWDFDVFQFERLAKERSLQVIAMQAFTHHELFLVLEIQPKVVLDYLVVIEQGYNKRCPFHNSMHAADVVQAFNVLVTWLNGKEHAVVTGVDAVAGLLASAVHDYEHPGFNNHYLVRTRHHTALRYNDNSVLENHHISVAFRVMLGMPTDPLSNLSEGQHQQVRRMMISMVLATDIGTHFSELSLFKTKLSSKDFPASSKGEDKMVLMNILLHAADMSNPARSLDLYAQWVPRVMEEFFRQGDIEKDKNMPVSTFYDRDNTNVAKCQMGFMDVLVLPLFSVLATVIPQMNESVVPHLHANRAAFAAQEATDRGDDHYHREHRKRDEGKRGCPSWVSGLLRKLRRRRGTQAPVAVPSATLPGSSPYPGDSGPGLASESTGGSKKIGVASKMGSSKSDAKKANRQGSKSPSRDAREDSKEA